MGLRKRFHYHIAHKRWSLVPEGSYYALGHWDQASLLSQLRHSILTSLVARKCLQLETARLLES